MSDKQEWEDFWKKGIETIAGQRYDIERLTDLNKRLVYCLESAHRINDRLGRQDDKQ